METFKLKFYPDYNVKNEDAIEHTFVYVSGKDKETNHKDGFKAIVAEYPRAYQIEVVKATLH